MCSLSIALIAACEGTSGGPDAGADGGFGDAALVVVPPTHIVDESRDLGLLLTMRALPNDDPKDVPSVIEIAAYDTHRGDLVWSDREEIWGTFVFAASRPVRDRGRGFIWVDASGRERLRFMAPNGLSPMASGTQHSRQSNGYFRWVNEANEYLDIDGRVVPRAAAGFEERTHIMYEGPWE
jgi:hypothetical protein